MSLDAGMTLNEALDFFRNKGIAISPNSWRDVWQEAHARSWTVARVTSIEVLNDIRGMVDKAIGEGITFKEFFDDLESKLIKAGWWAEDDEDPFLDIGDGIKIKRLQPWRLSVIYNTNMQAAYSVGRYGNMIDNAEDRPYWMYDAVMDASTRKSHAEMDGKVYRYDDPFWETAYPPNGFSCRCTIRALKQRDLDRRGLKVETKPSNFQPDEGWAYNVGKEGLRAYKPDLSKYPDDLVSQSGL